MATLIRLFNNQTTNNGVLYVTFSIQPDSITPALQTLIQDFGEPTISVGGTLTPGGGVPPFTIPVVVLRVVSDLPYQAAFDPSNAAFSPSNLQAQAEYYVTEFTNLYNDAITTLQANVDTWTAQSIISFPT